MSLEIVKEICVQCHALIDELRQKPTPNPSVHGELKVSRSYLVSGDWAGGPTITVTLHWCSSTCLGDWLAALQENTKPRPPADSRQGGRVQPS